MGGNSKMPATKSAIAAHLLLESPDGYLAVEKPSPYRGRRQKHCLPGRHVYLVDVSHCRAACLPSLRNCSRSPRAPAEEERGEKLPEDRVKWRLSQRSTVRRLERQLRAQCALDDLIDAHLAHIRDEYHNSSASQPLHTAVMAPWNAALANAAFSWLGDWRPSAVLSLPQLLAAYDPSFPPLSTLALRSLAEAARRLRAHERDIEDQLAGLQTTCALIAIGGSDDKFATAAAARRKIAKVEVVVDRAQKLRYWAVETAARRVLDRTQAAAFLVALAGVQDLVHQKAALWRARVGPVAIGSC